MVSTERLYYSDSYLRHFEASIVAQTDGGRRVYLDRTAFYPTSGGQPHDTGILGAVSVIDVVDEGEAIAHVLSEPLHGDRVVGEVDWPRRFDHMQQHTGQHLLSAVLVEMLGHDTISVHFGPEASTIDIEATQLSSEQAKRVEQRANEIVVENRPVHIGFEEASEALGLRKRPDRGGPLRIVTIPNLDRSACGGTHVRTTGEIGSILIRKTERVRRAIRIEFLCGSRAIRRARTDYQLLSRLSTEFSAPAAELPGLIQSQRAELKEANAARRELEASLAHYRARELYLAAQPDSTGLRRVVFQDESGSLDGLRPLAQAYSTLDRGIFVGVVTEPPGVLLATSADSGVDAAGVLKGLLSGVGGRGGGSAGLAQGTVPGRAQLDEVLSSLGVTMRP